MSFKWYFRLNYRYYNGNGIDSFLYSASMPEGFFFFFIFIHYDNFYLLTSISCSNIFFALWCTTFFLLRLGTAGYDVFCLFLVLYLGTFIHDSHHQYSWDTGLMEAIVKFLLSLSCFLFINFLVYSRKNVKPKAKWGLQIGKGSGIWDRNMINIFWSLGLKRKPIHRLVRTFLI